MNFTLPLSDLVGLFLGFMFTLFIFSYIFDDNFLFRLTINIFIGVSAGYAGTVAFYSILWPRLIYPLIAGNHEERLLAIIPLVLSVLLLSKISPRLAHFGNPSMAYLVGVGAATAIGGAIIGTLFPQVWASINLLNRQAAISSGTNFWLYLINGGIVLVGTIATLVYFQFSISSRNRLHGKQSDRIESLGKIGQVFIAITFGVMFAGIYAAALVALIERLSSLINFIRPLLESFF